MDPGVDAFDCAIDEPNGLRSNLEQREVELSLQVEFGEICLVLHGIAERLAALTKKPSFLLPASHEKLALT